MARAERPVCGVCGKLGRADDIPPEIQPCRFQTAVENYTIDLCGDCRTNRTLGEIREHAVGTPGGTVRGADRIPYMVVV